MSNLMLLSFGGVFMLMLLGSGMMMLRQSRQQERFAARVRLIHGQAPIVKAGAAEREAIKVALMRAIGGMGQLILRSGVLSAGTRTELEHTLATSGLHGANGLAVYVGAKLLLMAGLPALAWITLHDANLPGLIHTPGPTGGGRGRTDGAGLDRREAAPALPGPIGARSA